MATTTTATETTSQDERGSRRTIQGLVTSTKMEKTAVITVIRRVRDRRFHKFVTRRVKYKAHDEHNTAKVGDLVEIIEARPMSRTKRWRILRTLKNAIEQVADEAASTESTSKAAPAPKTPPAKGAR
jgi:small subunit ribosomal protein S17